MKYIYTGKKENMEEVYKLQCTKGETCSSRIQGNEMDDSKEELLCKNNVLFKSTRMLPTLLIQRAMIQKVIKFLLHSIEGSIMITHPDSS